MDSPQDRITGSFTAMPVPHVVGPEPGATPASLTGRARSHHTLPEDLLREASKRLGIMALMAAVLWVIGPLLGHLALRAMLPGDPRWLRIQTSDVIAAVAVPVSIALYFYTRKSQRSPQFILDLGLGYLVVNALALGLMWHSDPTAWNRAMTPEISWIGALVLIFPAIVPTKPGRMLVVGLISASMMPLGMLIAQWRGTWDFGPASNVLLMHYPDYLQVGVGVVIAHVVTGLGHQVTKARDMGSYHVGELLGRGGMGEVYLATHRMLARPAAIKLIRPEIIAPGGGEAADLAVKRFRREAEVAANLRSPHTVELYDFGVMENQTLYFVMELLEGMNLEVLVKSHGAVPASRVIHILTQVCESLEEAHVRGLVHRDIKPANIHIGRLGLENDFVKVLDFGLVKTMTGTTGEHSMATGAGMTPGTPDYMAPEMLLNEPVDARADLYALGCVAYNLLTARPVFEAPSVWAVMAKHMNEPPVLPSVRAGIAVPPELERLVMDCLQKSPANRPQSAAALGRALAALAVPRWTQEDATGWWRNHQPQA